MKRLIKRKGRKGWRKRKIDGKDMVLKKERKDIRGLLLKIGEKREKIEEINGNERRNGMEKEIKKKEILKRKEKKIEKIKKWNRKKREGEEKIGVEWNRKGRKKRILIKKGG